MALPAWKRSGIIESKLGRIEMDETIAWSLTRTISVGKEMPAILGAKVHNMLEEKHQGTMTGGTGTTGGPERGTGMMIETEIARECTKSRIETEMEIGTGTGIEVG